MFVNTDQGTTGEVKIFDLQGKIIECSQTTNDKITIDLSSQNAGIYIAQFKTDNKLVTEKVVIQ